MNGVRLAYEEHGDGEPLVLVCGLGQPALSWQFSILPGLLAAGFKVVDKPQNLMWLSTSTWDRR